MTNIGNGTKTQKLMTWLRKTTELEKLLKRLKVDHLQRKLKVIIKSRTFNSDDSEILDRFPVKISENLIKKTNKVTKMLTHTSICSCPIPLKSPPKSEQIKKQNEITKRR